MADQPVLPPTFYERLLRFFCKDELYNELQGDLDEEFYENYETKGIRYARKVYRREVLKMIRPSILKSFNSNPNTPSAMFRINAKLAFRNLISHKRYTLINVGGLALSSTVCGLILLYVQSERNYDNYHPNGDRLYRLVLDRIYPDHVSHYAISPMGISKQTEIDFPEIEVVNRIFPGTGVNISIENEHFLESQFMATDPNFFHIFGIKLLRGNPDDVLAQPNATVLTESAAIKYFGSTDILGKTMTSGFGELIVTGIAEDVPENTHFTFNMLVPLELMPQNFLKETNFINFSVHAYLRVQEGVTQDQVEERIEQTVRKHAAGQIERYLKIPYSEFEANGNGYRYYVQRVRDIHLESQLEREHMPNGNRSYIIIFSSVAVFIILLAAINFINLATARSAERAKEVGIRKVLGSGKGNLVSQFLIESIFVCVLAMIIGIGLIYASMPAFNDFANKQMELDLLQQPLTLLLLLFMAIGLGILAGLYPAFVLSSFRPIVVLKGKLIRRKSSGWIRNGLVVFQFLVSVVLICSTLIVGQQMRYLQQHNLGFEKENVLLIDRVGELESIETFQNELKQLPEVIDAAGSSSVPGLDLAFGLSFQQLEKELESAVSCVIAQDDYIETMKMELIAGRTFSEAFQDSLSIILNESAARALGIQDDPIGQTITNVQGGNNRSGDMHYRVIGVLSDYNYKSLHTEITPLVMMSEHSPFASRISSMAVRVSSSSPKNVGRIEEIWNEQAQGEPFVYQYLEDGLDQLYVQEARSGQLFFVFATIAILIACIGLFGLATFIISGRIKEIGVRKVLGASATKVVMLIVNDFNKLILMALVISIPIVVLVMKDWLNDFAYHISWVSTWSSFVIGGATALAVAWLTVSYHSIKAALTNPVKNLRTE